MRDSSGMYKDSVTPYFIHSLPRNKALDFLAEDAVGGGGGGSGGFGGAGLGILKKAAGGGAAYTALSQVDELEINVMKQPLNQPLAENAGTGETGRYQLLPNDFQKVSKRFPNVLHVYTVSWERRAFLSDTFGK